MWFLKKILTIVRRRNGKTMMIIPRWRTKNTPPKGRRRWIVQQIIRKQQDNNNNKKTTKQKEGRRKMKKKQTQKRIDQRDPKKRKTKKHVMLENEALKSERVSSCTPNVPAWVSTIFWKMTQLVPNMGKHIAEESYFPYHRRVPYHFFWSWFLLVAVVQEITLRWHRN